MKMLVTLALAACVLAACDKDNDPSTPPEPVPDPQASAAIRVLPAIAEAATKTTITNSTAAWADGDMIGLYSTESSPAAANLKFTYAASGSTWTPTSTINWSNGSTSHKFLAYAPWITGSFASTAVPLPALNTQNGTISPSQDFLISNNQGSGLTRPGDNAVPLTFKHALSLIQLDIKIDGSILSGTTLTSVMVASSTSTDKLYTTDGTSTIDLSTGTITAANGVTSSTLTATPATAPTLSTSTTSLYILLLPGTFTAPKLTLTINENSVPITVPGTSLVTTAFVAATRYPYIVTVSRNGLTISPQTITEWGTGTGGNVGAKL